MGYVLLVRKHWLRKYLLMNGQVSRIYGIDIFRGWAIVLMVIFHLFYDLNYFHYISIDMHRETFWRYARFVIISMFLFTVGVSLALTHRPEIKWKKMWKRTWMLGGAAILVSIATYIEFPRYWVYFGILHFILLASWLGLLFLPYPKLSLLTAIILLVGYNMHWLHMHWLFDLVKDILNLPPGFTVDLVGLVPWFAMVLLGICTVQYRWYKAFFTASFFTISQPLNRALSYLGRHALIIYLVHQPILFGVFMLFT